jgi:hypothetical protein
MLKFKKEYDEDGDVKVLLIGGPKDGEKVIIPCDRRGQSIQFAIVERPDLTYNPDLNSKLPLFSHKYVNYFPMIEFVNGFNLTLGFQVYLFENMSEKEGVERLILNYKPRKPRGPRKPRKLKFP